MKKKTEIMDSTGVLRAMARITHEIIERNQGARDICLLGVKSRGVPLSRMLAANIQRFEGVEVPVGLLDITRHRDDLSQEEKQAAELTALGFDKLPICMAKTQYSFSDDAALLGAPKGFTITVRNLKVSAGAGFLVALTGDIMTMPGLPKVPAAEKIDVDENGKISGLF